MNDRKKKQPNRLLIQARKAKNLNQPQLAEKIGTTQVSVGRWERGEVLPSAYYREKLCKFFNTSNEALGLLEGNYPSAEEDEVQEETTLASLLEDSSSPNEQQEQHVAANPPSSSLFLPLEQTLDSKQEGKITLQSFFRKHPLVLVILGLIVSVMVTSESVLIFGQKTQVPTNKTVTPPLGSPIFAYQLPKIGSYETLVNALAWSPNSSYLACASGDKVVRIFELGTENEVTIFHGHSRNVNSTVWLPNGTQIASASTDQTVQIWDAFTGHALMMFSSASQVWAVAVSPDGKEIAWAGKDGITEVWQITPQMHLFTYTEQAGSGGIWGLAFSHDGKLLAAGDNTGDIQIFDTKNGKIVLNYTEQTQTIYGLDWSPDDRYIASASGDSLGSNGSVRVWNTSSGKTAYTYEYHKVAMQSVSWSPDGARIVSAGDDGTVQVWDAFNGKHLFIYKHHSGVVYTVAWSPDGNKIASGDGNGDIQVWWAK